MTDSREDSHEDLLVDIAVEFSQRLQRGEGPSIQEYLEKYPHDAESIRQMLEGLLLLENTTSIDMANENPGQYLSMPSELAGAQPIGDFQIVREIGRGGMGIVYEAVQLSLGRKVALKVLPFASALDDVRLQRFRNESHAAAGLHHTNIVPVYAVGCERGLHYYAMQLIDGNTLAEVISELREDARTSANAPRASSTQRGVITLAEKQKHYRLCASMILQAANAVDQAHQYGIVHRDIKPANLLRDRSGKVWVTDFGLAQIESESRSLTRTGNPIGTLRYMSPEQASGEHSLTDHHTDIYSLGITLYELLVLQPAFSEQTPRGLLRAVMDDEPRRLRSVDPSIPSELATIVHKSISKSPSDRYGSAQALADDLQRWLQDRPIAARPPTVLERIHKWRKRNSGLVAIVSGVLLTSTLALAVATYWIWQQKQKINNALTAEQVQRRIAEQNWLRSKNVVDSFSDLVEQELSFRPDLQDVRKQLLELSLQFYQDFRNQRPSDLQIVQAMERTTLQVQRLVNELRTLENIQPWSLLLDARVQNDLQLSVEESAHWKQTIERLLREREELANQYSGGLLSDNPAFTGWLESFQSEVHSHFSDQQSERLRQIHRQKWLPFTFKTREVVEALELTREQQFDINRIIEETRPSRKPDSKQNGSMHSQFPDGPVPNRPPPSSPRLQWIGPPPGTEITVREIQRILSEEQKGRWDMLCGKPFIFLHAER